MEFRILGPLEVRRGDRPLGLGGGKQRSLLALLLLHRNEVVPIERLVDELWGERAPETAAKIVQNYVSLLRRALAEEDGDSGVALVTQGHGYVLRIETGELDLDRFEGLLAQGREALAAGDAAEASARLREALGLWRGDPLADLAYEPFAQAEVARLEERRLVALECRIETDLALGRQADLVGELETLVARHPLREQIQGQLMLSLYRSGRQAEALEVYQEARRRLVDELGIEPGPALRALEQAILRQDESLSPPPRSRSRATGRSSRKRRLALTAILTGAGAAAVFVAVVAVEGIRESSRAEGVLGPGIAVVPNSVVVIDPKTNRVADVIPVGTGPGPIEVGKGSVWVANVEEATVSRIDAETREVVATIGLGIEPTALAVGGDSVWVAGGRDAALLRIDARNNRIREWIAIREKIGPLPAGYERGPSGVAVGEGAVWLAHGEEVSRIDPATGKVVATIPAGGNWSGAIAAGAGAVWVAENDSLKVRRSEPGSTTGISRIDPGSNAVTVTIPLPGLKPPGTGVSLLSGAIAVGEGGVWAAAAAADVLWRIDVDTAQVTRTIPGGHTPASVAAGLGAVWVENHSDETVVRIDPFSNVLVETIAIGRPTRGIAVGEGAVWVTVVP